MTHLGRTLCAAALAMALSAAAYAQVGGTVAPGAGLTKAPNDRGDDSPDATRSGSLAEPRSNSAAARPDRGKANGLNMGTRSGANSDVNRPRNGLKEKSQ